MRSLLLFLVCVASASVGSARAAEQRNPFLIVPINDDFLNHPMIRGFFADLLRQGGLGYRYTEAAAFVVLDDDGDYRCVMWPFDGNYHRQQFRGSAPDQTIAIIHTHPENSPFGSAGDAQTAMKLGIPVFALTRNNIYMVRSNGSAEPIEKGRFWSAGLKVESRCSRR